MVVMGPQNGVGGEAATNSGPSQAPLQPNGVHAPETDAAAPGEVGEEGAAQAWDAREDLPTMPGFRLLHSLTGHARAVSSVKFARQSPLLASASADGTAKLWNADTGQLVHTLQGHTKVGGRGSLSAATLGFCRMGGVALCRDRECRMREGSCSCGI